MGDGPGAKSDIDVRVEVSTLSLRLGVTAADGHDRLGPFAAFAWPRYAHVCREALVGLLPDRARVEDEHVGLVRIGRLAKAELLECALDPLRVVGVHLAANERRDVVTAHLRQGSRAVRSSR